jgi:hypothetical protein
VDVALSDVVALVRKRVEEDAAVGSKHKSWPLAILPAADCAVFQNRLLQHEQAEAEG